MRKARILADQGDVEKSLSLVGSLPVGGYAVSLNELKGDLFLLKGDIELARQSYQKAFDATTANNRPVLEMKLNDLAAEGS
jgi:predicted negative regulator of RcsB-dependent stress response